MSCKLKVVVSLLRIIATLLSLRPFGNIIFLHLKIKSETQFLTQKSLKSLVAVSILLT